MSTFFVQLNKALTLAIVGVIFSAGFLSAQPVLTISSTGPCTSDTLFVGSNLVDSQIIWKRNGVAVDTEKSHLLTYGTTLGFDSIVHGVTVDTNGNVFVSYEKTQLCTYCSSIYKIVKYPAGSSLGTTLISSSATSAIIGDIFVDKGDTIYATWRTPTDNGIMKFAPGSSTGTWVAGGNGFGSAANQLYYPSSVFVDKNRNVYVSDQDNHRIQKWAPGATSGITVAGGNGLVWGSADSLLYFPRGVFVDDSDNVYISDYGNNRVQKWGPGATTGITIAGLYGGPGANPWELDGPDGLYVDPNGYLFISDQNNHRIQEFPPSATFGITIEGGNGQGNANNQFYKPVNFQFDKYGNLYVADGRNGRVQRFADTVLPYYIPTAGGTYTAKVKAGNGSSATSPAIQVLDYGLPGATISVPNSGSPCHNDTAFLTAIPTNGGSAPTYDWYRNLLYITTTTDSTYTLPGIANGDHIVCYIHSNYACLYPPGFAASNQLTMVVDTGALTQTVAITASPGNVIQYGQNVTFTATSVYGGSGYQWYKNTLIIPGATTSTYSDNSLVNGDKITCVSYSTLPCVWNQNVVSNIVDMHVSVDVNKVNNIVSELSMSPNPNNGTFSLRGIVDPSCKEVVIELLDMPGRILQRESVAVQNAVFSKQMSTAASLSSGIYILRVSAGGRNETMRFVINR